MSSALAGRFFTTEPPGKPNGVFLWSKILNFDEVQFFPFKDWALVSSLKDKDSEDLLCYSLKVL